MELIIGLSVYVFPIETNVWERPGVPRARNLIKLQVHHLDHTVTCVIFIFSNVRGCGISFFFHFWQMGIPLHIYIYYIYIYIYVHCGVRSAEGVLLLENAEGLNCSVHSFFHASASVCLRIKYK